MKRDKYESLVKEIVEREWVCNVLEIKFLGGGSFGKAYKVKTDYNIEYAVVKLFFACGLCVNEASDLKILKEANEIKIPEVYFVKTAEQQEIIDCICMEYISGANCLTLAPKFIFRAKKRKKFVDDVLNVVYKLQTHKSNKFGFARNPEYDTWQEFYKNFVGELLKKAKCMQAKGKIKKKIYDLAEYSFSKFSEIFDEKINCACLSHGDINVMNMMADEKTLELKSFIDPLNALYCDPEYDLYELGVMTERVFGLRKKYKEQRVVTKKCDLKVAVYGFFAELRCYVGTGKYTHFIMNQAIRELKKQLRIFGI